MQSFLRHLLFCSFFAALTACHKADKDDPSARWLRTETGENGQQEYYLKFGKDWRRIDVKQVVLLNQVRALGLSESPHYQLLQPGTLLPKSICSGGQLNWSPDRAFLDCAVISRDNDSYHLEQIRYDLNGDVVEQILSDVRNSELELVSKPGFYSARGQRFFLLQKPESSKDAVKRCALVAQEPDGKLLQFEATGDVAKTDCFDAKYWSGLVGGEIRAIAASEML